MADKPASPFANLGTDKALLRSTRPQDASPPAAPDALPPTVEPVQARTESPKKTAPPPAPKARTQRTNDDTTSPRNRDTVVSRHHEDTVEALRRAVRVIGKEAATYRFSAEEKSRMADLVYTYKRHGVRTSENEISRIALNFIFRDYEEAGEDSILAKVLDALNS